MSLRIKTDMITDKQKDWLKDNGYYGNLNLTKREATEIIEGLMEEQRQERLKPEALYYERFKEING